MNNLNWSTPQTPSATESAFFDNTATRGVFSENESVISGDIQMGVTDKSMGITLDGSSFALNGSIVLFGSSFGNTLTLQSNSVLQTEHDILLGYNNATNIAGSTFLNIIQGSRIIQETSQNFITSATNAHNTSILITDPGTSATFGNTILSKAGVTNTFIEDSAKVTFNTLQLAESSNSVSNLVISNNSEVASDKQLTVGVLGNALLQISTGAVMQLNQGNIVVGLDDGSVSKIVIGSKEGENPVAPGSLKSNKIILNKNSNLLFNHTNRIDYTFNTEISGGGSVELLFGYTNFLKNATHAGGTIIHDNAVLDLGSSAQPVDFFSSVSISTLGKLQGFGTTGDLTNSGQIIIGNNSTFGKISVHGDYLGSGGIIDFDTTLNGDDSQTDQLEITGYTSGTSVVRINNIGGSGALTNEGIRIITVEGASNGSFLLKGDYVTAAGEQAVVAGAYAYELQKNGISTPNDGNWYLRSDAKDCPAPPTPGPTPGPTPDPTPAPCYQPGVPLYTAEAQIISMMNRDSYTSLNERVGDRFWSGNAAYVIPQGADPILPDNNQALTDIGLVWLKASASYEKYELSNVDANHTYEQDSYRIRAGLDNQFYESENGIAIWGLWGQFINADAKTSSVYGAGSIDINNYGIGGSLTWYGENGFYIDGQTQVNWYYSNLDSTTMNVRLVNNHKSMGYGGSLEAGKRIQYNQNWSFTPQAQLIYSTIDQDNYTDINHTIIRTSGFNTLTGRIGISANYETAWQATNGTTSRLDNRAIYSLLKNQLSDDDRIYVSDTAIKTGIKETVWSEIGLSTTYSWNDGKYALYGNLKSRLAFKDISNNYNISGNVGLRIKW